MQNILKSAMKVSVICGLLLLVLVDMGQAACNGDPSINGCRIPRGYHGVVLFTQEFREVCNRQVVCYSCGSGGGISRSSCDEAFRADLLQYCRSNRVIFCDIAAQKYYEVAREFAGYLFQSSPRNFCSESWVPPCLPA